MNKTTLLLILFFFSNLIFAQNKIDVRVSNPSFNFGYIKESEGKVSIDFEFKNHSSVPVKVIKAVSSCGCAVIRVDREEYKPNSTGKITIEYNPDGRPGKFLKSFEVVFGSDSLSKQSVYLNIRGYTIEKELLEAYVDNLYEGSKLMIKSARFNLINESDFRYTQEDKYQNFLNDITYEIDENGFTNLKVEILFSINNKNECEKYQNIYSFVHRDIISELERRNYQAYQIGFKDTCIIVEKMALQNGANLKISSLKYNSDTIQESGYYFSGKPIDEKKFQFDRFKDSTEYAKKEIAHFNFFTIKDFNEDKNERYKAFLTQVSRRLIVQNSVNLGFTTEIKCHPKSEEKIREKYLQGITKYYEKLKHDIDEYGGNPASLKFSLPNFLFQLDTLMKPGKSIVRMNQVSLFHNEIKPASENVFENFLITDTIGNLKLNDFLTQTGFQDPFQNLPVFKTSADQNFTLDTASLLFKSWFNIIKEELQKNKKIHFIIESSIANSPNEKTANLPYFSRRNAKNTQENLMKLLALKGIPDSSVHIDIKSTIVQGAKFNSKEFNVSYNAAFNYIKIIPVYELNKEIKSILVPYQINFNNNSFDLPSNTSIFQNFISRIIPVIEKEGWIGITIESSSSKIPSTIYKNNELLSYFRAEQAAKTVKDEVRKRGYDPSRVIITETRTLVQGPEFKKETDKQRYSYDKYQYVKIIPDRLIKN